MHELPAAEIDADVRVPPPPFVEEHQVSPPQARHPDAGRGASLLLGVARQGHAGLPEAVLDEPAAIETLSGRRATEAIGVSIAAGSSSTASGKPAWPCRATPSSRATPACRKLYWTSPRQSK